MIGKGVIFFIPFFLLIYFLPQSFLMQIGSLLDLKPHHVEHKLYVLYAIMLFSWITFTTIRLVYQTSKKQIKV